MHKITFTFFLSILFQNSANCNIPQVTYCTPNTTENHVEGINLNISPFPIPLSNGKSVSIQFSFDVVKDIPIGSSVQIRLVEQGAIPTPLPCFPVITCIYFRNHNYYLNPY